MPLSVPSAGEYSATGTTAVRWLLSGTSRSRMRVPREYPVWASGDGSSAARAATESGAALVHGAVALGDLVQGQLQVEHLAGVDRPVPDQVDQLGQEAAHRRRAAVQMDFREEQLLAGQFHAVGDADVADVTAEPGGADGLQHRLLGADGLNGRVRAEAVGELLDRRHARVAALGDDLARAELA